jgi:hypothetical protein
MLHRIVLAALAVVFTTAAARADIKIKSKTSFGEQTGVEQTVYIKAKRQRTESAGGVATVTQCDLRRTVQLNDMSRTYTLNPFDAGGAEAATAEAPERGSQTNGFKRGGVVTMTYAVTDTGERKQMFGYTARRIKTVITTEPSPDACSQERTRMETDGWYIDLNVGFDCYESAAVASAPRGAAGGCQDKVRTKQVGGAKLGYPVKVTTTVFGDDGKPSQSFTQEVVELSQATLEQALFEIPAGYREVKDARELYSASAMAAAMSADDEDKDEDKEEGKDESARPGRTSPVRSVVGGMTSNPARANGANTSGGANVPDASGRPKKAGVLRVGLAPAKTGSVGEGMDARTLAEAVRSTLASYLTGPTVEVVRLEALLPQQAEAEAREKGCDLVLYASASHKKGGGGGLGGFLKKAAPIADDLVPYGDDAAEHAASQAATETLYTAADAAGSVKAKDELTIEFRVQGLAPGAAPLAKTVKAKAKADGDDLVSRLAEQVASEVLAAAGKGR